jgi:hypothetical protein
VSNKTLLETLALTRASITPWLTDLGYQNCFISAAFVGMAASAVFLIMIKYGKRLRVRSSSKYYSIVNADKAMS